MKVKNITADETVIIQTAGSSFKAIFPGDIVELEDSEGYTAIKNSKGYLIVEVDSPRASAKTKVEPEVRG